MNKGFFITLEGIDGSGKSLLGKRIEEYYKNIDRDVILTKEPFENSLKNDFKNLLNNYLNDSLIKNDFSSSFEYLIFAADRSLHIKEVIKPYLEKNFIVISDRFFDSSLVYQGYIGNLNIDFMKNIFNETNFNIFPDLTIYCNVDVKTAIERINKRGNLDGLDKKAVNNLIKLKEGYDKLYQNKKNNLYILNANLNENDIYNNILNILKEINI